jgi:hypothetical protein
MIVMETSRTFSALQIPMRMPKTFFEFCRKFEQAPSKIFGSPAVEYRGCVSSGGFDDVTEDIDSFVA